MMEPKDQILKEVDAFTTAAEKAREDFQIRAIRLADAVVRNRDTIRDLKGSIGGYTCAFIEAQERYTKAVREVTEACVRLHRFLDGCSKGGEE